MLRFQLSVLLLAVGALGCVADRYEIKEDQQGRIVRIDKRTGEIAVLEGDKFEVKTPPGFWRSLLGNQRDLSEPKSWPTRAIEPLGADSALLGTSWRNGNLYYKLSLSPVSDRLRKARESEFVTDYHITVNLYDSMGFKVLEIPLLVNSLVGSVDEKGDLQRLVRNGWVACSRGDYERVSSWRLRLASVLPDPER